MCWDASLDICWHKAHMLEGRLSEGNSNRYLKSIYDQSTMHCTKCYESIKDELIARCLNIFDNYYYIQASYLSRKYS
ncbi:hypothetical protein HZS_5613 [Henneguya salminicola]|nr:hypothetical protein HZS_5613 [Henneguya salminicola]